MSFGGALGATHGRLVRDDEAPVHRAFGVIAKRYALGSLGGFWRLLHGKSAFEFGAHLVYANARQDTSWWLAPYLRAQLHPRRLRGWGFLLGAGADEPVVQYDVFVAGIGHRRMGHHRVYGAAVFGSRLAPELAGQRDHFDGIAQTAEASHGGLGGMLAATFEPSAHQRWHAALRFGRRHALLSARLEWSRGALPAVAPPGS